MGVLRVIRAAVLIVIMLIAMAFAFLNNQQMVDVNLYWGRLIDAPMAWVVFCAFLLGALVGYAISLTKLMELQGRLHELRRSQGRLETDLATLRNLPLEDVGPPGGSEEAES